jgi:hypothetical protein
LAGEAARAPLDCDTEPDAGRSVVRRGYDLTRVHLERWVGQDRGDSSSVVAAEARQDKGKHRDQAQGCDKAARHAGETAAPPHGSFRSHAIRALRKRSALPITLTEESAIAAAAIAGDSSSPNTG